MVMALCRHGAVALVRHVCNAKPVAARKLHPNTPWPPAACNQHLTAQTAHHSVTRLHVCRLFRAAAPLLAPVCLHAAAPGLQESDRLALTRLRCDLTHRDRLVHAASTCNTVPSSAFSSPGEPAEKTSRATLGWQGRGGARAAGRQKAAPPPGARGAAKTLGVLGREVSNTGLHALYETMLLLCRARIKNYIVYKTKLKSGLHPLRLRSWCIFIPIGRQRQRLLVMTS